MKDMTRILLLASLVLLCLSSTMFSAEARTVHALLVIMDYDHTAPEGEVGIGPGCTAGQFYVEDFLTSLEPTLAVKITTLWSSTGTAKFAQIEQWLVSVQPGSDDVVFVYYAGHGGMENWETKRTYFCTLDDVYPRRDMVVNSIKNYTVGARLQILVTDCCSNTSEPPPVQVEKASALLSQQVLADLFLRHTGFLHITGATEGQFSFITVPSLADLEEIPRSQWRSEGFGGWFIRHLLDAIDEVPDANNDGFVSWTEVFESTVAKTEGRFSRTKPYLSDDIKRDLERLRITSQTPKAYSLPDGTGPVGIPPVQLKGNVFIKGVDDEGWFEDETDELDHDIDIYLREGQKPLYVPDLHWGGECRVEVDLSARLIDIDKVEIWGSVKLFEGTSVHTNDLEDQKDIYLIVPEKEPVEITVATLDEFGNRIPETISIVRQNPIPVDRLYNLENWGTGGGDTADIRLSFWVEKINVDGTTRAYVERGKAAVYGADYKSAIVNAAKALHLKPYDPKAHYWHGVARYKLGDYSNAITAFDETLRYKFDDVYAYHWRGTAKYALEQYELAIADHSEALAIKPNRAYDYYWRGMARYQLGQYEAAAADFDEALRFDPNHAYAYHGRANANEKLGRTSTAIQDFQASLRLAEIAGDNELKAGNERWLKALSK